MLSASSYVAFSKIVTMFSVIEAMKAPQSKKRYESCCETSIDFMSYLVLSFRTETLSSYQSCDKVYANDLRSRSIYLRSIIQKLMNNRNESIRTLNADFEPTAITCRMTESNDYQWLSSVTILTSSQSLQ